MNNMIGVKSKKERGLTGGVLKIVRKVYNWVTKDMPPIKQEKIDTFIEEWNKSEGKNVWTETTGTFALMQMKIDSNNTVSFNSDFGYPLKAFRNSETEEIRIFDARRFT